MPLIRVINLISVVFVLSGCVLSDPRLSTATATKVSEKTTTVLYRDLTTSWADRYYWDNQYQAKPTRKKRTTLPAVTNAYLAGRYATPPVTNTAVSFARPSPIAALPAPGPVSSPDVKTSGVSYTDIAEGIGSVSLPRGLSYKIWFAKDKDVLGPQGRERVQRLADNPDFNRAIWLRGHTLADEASVDTDRFAVGRAISVRKELTALGFSESVRIKYTNPAVSGRYVEVTAQ